MVETLNSPLQGARVPSMVGELKSHVQKKKKKRKFLELNKNEITIYQLKIFFK